MELETINKLYLELSQIATAKTAREIELEGKILKNEDILTVGHLFLHDHDKGWAKISSGLDQDFQGGMSGFNVRHDDGTEYRVSFRVQEI